MLAADRGWQPTVAAYDRLVTPAQARELLGVQPGASAAEMERAFRGRAWELHPDRGGDDVAFSRLVEARRVLGRLTRSPYAASPSAASPRAASPRAASPHAPDAHRPADVTVESSTAMTRRLVRAKVRRWMGKGGDRHLE
jgi:hypothetical protein